jgi:hypothetical protein
MGLFSKKQDKMAFPPEVLRYLSTNPDFKSRGLTRIMTQPDLLDLAKRIGPADYGWLVKATRQDSPMGSREVYTLWNPEYLRPEWQRQLPIIEIDRILHRMRTSLLKTDAGAIIMFYLESTVDAESHMSPHLRNLGMPSWRRLDFFFGQSDYVNFRDAKELAEIGYERPAESPSGPRSVTVEQPPTPNEVGRVDSSSPGKTSVRNHGSSPPVTSERSCSNCGAHHPGQGDECRWCHKPLPTGSGSAGESASRRHDQRYACKSCGGSTWPSGGPICGKCRELDSDRIYTATPTSTGATPIKLPKSVQGRSVGGSAATQNTGLDARYICGVCGGTPWPSGGSVCATCQQAGLDPSYKSVSGQSQDHVKQPANRASRGSEETSHPDSSAGYAGLNTTIAALVSERERSGLTGVDFDRVRTLLGEDAESPPITVARVTVTELLLQASQHLHLDNPIKAEDSVLLALEIMRRGKVDECDPKLAPVYLTASIVAHHNGRSRLRYACAKACLAVCLPGSEEHELALVLLEQGEG